MLIQENPCKYSTEFQEGTEVFMGDLTKDLYPLEAYVDTGEPCINISLQTVEDLP